MGENQTGGPGVIGIGDRAIAGKGMTADVYRLEGNKALKLFNSGYGIEAVTYEAHIAKCIGETPLRSPGYHGTVEVEGRHGILYDFIEGESPLGAVLESPRSGFEICRRMAEVHADIHRHSHPLLPSQVDRLGYQISRAEGLGEAGERLRRALPILSTESRICHGDFHMGNILVSGEDWYGIDWMNAYAGNPAGDVYRSYLMLASPYLPMPLTPIRKLVFLAYKRLLARFYVRRYLKLTHLKMGDLRRWRSVIAAARLCDKVPGEEQWLRRIIRKNLHFIPTPANL